MNFAKRFLLLVLAVGTGLGLAACEPKSATAPGQPTLVSIAVSPSTVTLARGASKALTVNGTYSDNSVYDLTSTSTFLSSDTTVASVSPSGVVTAAAPGGAIITATDSKSGKTATAAITVPAPALVSIAVSPVTSVMAVQGTQALRVIGTYADASTADVTATSTFSSSDPTVATVTNAGLVKATGVGTVLISALESASGRSAAAAVTVKPSYTVLDFNSGGLSYTLAPFGGAAAALTSAGVPAGGPGNQVVKLTKTVGAQCYAGVTLSTGGSGSIGAIPFSATATTMQVQIYVPAASVGVDIKLKAENATNGAISVETDVVATTAGWQTLTFDFSKPAPGTPALNLNQTYNKISLFADFTCSNGKPPPGVDETFYVGPIVFLGALGPAAPPLPFTYTAVDMTDSALVLTAFGGSQPALTNAGVPGGGPTGQVMQFVRPAGAACYAGVTMSKGYLLSIGAVPFSATATTMTVPVNAPNAGMPILLKVEDATNPGVSVQTVTHTAAAGWQTMTFDFAQPLGAAIDTSKTYDKISIFPDFDPSVPGCPNAPATETFFVGSITFNGASAPSAPPLVAPPPPSTPTTFAPPPAVSVANVLSLWSSVPGGYNGTAADLGATDIDTWLTCWSGGTGGGTFAITVGANTANPRQWVMTPGGNYVGIEMLGKTGATSPGSCGGTVTGAHEIDISAMTFVHVDVWTPDDGSNLQIKLVDAGADGQVGTADDSSGIATLTAGSTPPLATGQWLSYELPLASAFPGLGAPATLKHLGQIVIVAPNGGTVYVDNFYFHN